MSEQKFSDLEHLGLKIMNPTKFIQELRLIKSESEIAILKKSCDIASLCINDTIRESSPGDTEHIIHARIDYKCRLMGASFLAFPPVVASGNNATIIHNTNNNQIAKKGDLILMDAGCEFAAYTSDITRTWPINGKFNKEQNILYDIILSVQKDLINLILKKQVESLDNLFENMCFLIGKYLQEECVISKRFEGVSLARQGYSFCPHHVSHYLGMDVHDTPLISRNIKLLPGMVCTVEPGIYIDKYKKDIPKEFRGIGIRIEDDILIKYDGVEVLSEKCLKEAYDLEKLVTESRKTNNL